MDLRTAVSLLPTPAVNDMGRAYTPETWDAWTERMKAAHGNGNGHGASLSIEALRMLPTPSAMAPDAKVSEKAKRLYSSSDRLGDLVEQNTWGQYAPAIARWEALTRPAPAPTEPTGKGGAHRLSPAFVEWMMGLPLGHVTDVPGVSRNDQLKALGNGVVPQQAAEAVRYLLAVRDMTTERAA
jgi:DNA (cytosine-5)-methyltransferase 1